MDQLELFGDTQKNPKKTMNFCLPDSEGSGKITKQPGLTRLRELSIDAYDAAVCATMSELPIEENISRFVEKVCRAGDGIVNGGTTGGSPEARAAAERAASDRGDPDVLVVLKAAYKVQHEIHRLSGFLRFNPDPGGVYIARCAPDHFILPALAEHFTLRFGETPWAIIDEKRLLCLFRGKGGEARIIPAPPDSESAGPASAAPKNRAGDYWEDLWRLYHRSTNNETKKNLSLQRQFIPERYRKYLTELG